VSSTNPTNGIKPGTNTEPTTGKKKPEESDFHPDTFHNIPREIYGWRMNNGVHVRK
jgi:hypothetical protein